MLCFPSCFWCLFCIFKSVWQIVTKNFQVRTLTTTGLLKFYMKQRKDDLSCRFTREAVADIHSDFPLICVAMKIWQSMSPFANLKPHEATYLPICWKSSPLCFLIKKVLLFLFIPLSFLKIHNHSGYLFTSETSVQNWSYPKDQEAIKTTIQIQ